ncbi:aminoglycoside phosphotransferase family protein [Derxia lacustris]|uniref:aminoglycoside phosphotransferase family protein n=1 Tax=Derxia lacustris TaxID=764842 RepID=UPI000A176219|nr:phosphotransferase [Derxia lacustris]
MTSPDAPDARLAELRDWLAPLAAAHGFDIATLAPASADASFRRYFRVTGDAGRSFVAMDAPPPQEDVRPFLHAAAEFARAGARVPAVHAQDAERGFLLLEDFGHTPYLNVLDASTANVLYGAAIKALVGFQVGGAGADFPAYDEALLRRELELFREWYCVKHLKLDLTLGDYKMLDNVFDAVVANNLAQPQVLVHRDYHSRNLMVIEDNFPGPGIIDFQDAVIGPITYDLVSLLRDAYIAWEEPQQMDWAIRYWEQARAAGLPVSEAFGDFYRDFDWMGLQRALKVLGIFARLAIRDGKTAYLDDIPRVLAYARKVAERYISLKHLMELFDRIEQRKPVIGYTF